MPIRKKVILQTFSFIHKKLENIHISVNCNPKIKEREKEDNEDGI